MWGNSRQSQQFTYQLLMSSQYTTLSLSSTQMVLQKTGLIQQVVYPLDFRMIVEFAYNLQPETLCQLTVLVDGLQLNLNVTRQSLQDIQRNLAGKVLFRNFESNYLIMETICNTKNSRIHICREIHSEILCCAKIIKTQDEFTQNEFNAHREISLYPHPNIIITRGVYQGRSFCVLVTEYLSGGTLFNYFLGQKGKFTLETARVMMTQALEGLSHLHKLGIMHRDIKLDNLMLASPNDIQSLKIIDLGFATQERNRLNRCGTPGYIAPEIFEIDSYTELCDIYSLGAVFHVLLSGQRMFEMNNKILQKNKQNQIKKSPLLSRYKLAEDLFDQMVKTRDSRPGAKECLDHPFFTQADEDEIEHDIQVKMQSMAFPQKSQIVQ